MLIENPQRENELDCPSFESFDAQLDCKIAKVLMKWGDRLECLPCFSLRSSLPLLFLPKELRTSRISPHTFCALAAFCVLNNRTEHSQGSSRSLSYTKGPVNFFVSWVGWVKDLRRTTWFSGGNRGGSDTSKSFGPSLKGVASFSRASHVSWDSVLTG